MEVMDYVTPTKTPRSMYTSPWRNNRLRYSRLEKNIGRQRPSPTSSFFSRSAFRVYGRIAVCSLVLLALLVSGVHFVEIGAPPQHVYHEEIALAHAAPAALHTYTSPLTKPKWEEHEDEESARASPPLSTQVTTPQEIDWNKQAYVTYATNIEYLCNALMLFAKLHELKTPAQKALIYPGYLAGDDSVSRMLRRARDEYDVQLEPVEGLRAEKQEVTWAESYTKLLVWNMTRFEKVVYLDCDGMVLQSLDELFHIPLLNSLAALPRAYWESVQPTYSSHFMLLQPSRSLLEDKMIPLFKKNEKDKFDMEIINTVLGPSCMVLPHRPLVLLSGEFFRTTEEHARYLGFPIDGQKMKWDPERELALAKTVHFSDWPIPKPWVMTSQMWVDQEAPFCTEAKFRGKDKAAVSTSRDCRDREAWLWLRAEFARRKAAVCGADAGLQISEILDGEVSGSKAAH